MQRVNPYTKLLSDIKSWCYQITYRHIKSMWVYQKSDLKGRWDLTDLFERTAAAEQLGYDVVLRATRAGLEVNYVKQVPSIPSSWKY